MFEETLPDLPKIPYVLSISYGSAEFAQCGNYALCSSVSFPSNFLEIS